MGKNPLTSEAGGSGAPAGREFDELLQSIVHDARSLVRRSQVCAQRMALPSATGADKEALLGELIEANRNVDDFLCRLGAYANASQPGPGQQVPLKAVLRAAAAAARDGAAVTLGFDSDSTGNVMVSPSLQTALTELVGNAAKFVKEGPAIIQLEARNLDGECIVEVRDNGIGVEERFLENVFEPLTRLHSRDRYPGYGLGLPICRRIVESLHGRVWLRNGESGGCIASVSLPQTRG